MIDREYQGFTYTMMSGGTYTRHEDAPIPPQEVLDQWHKEAKAALDAAIAAEVRREMDAYRRGR